MLLASVMEASLTSENTKVSRERESHLSAGVDSSVTSMTATEP